MARSCFLPLLLFIFTISKSQPNFIDVQKNNNYKVSKAYEKWTDSLKKQAKLCGLSWPIKQIYLRSFKYDSQLEVWGRNNPKEAFKLFTTFKICALSGDLGPKREKGDYQVPEGFYEIEVFNPNSEYHLSLGINYPNTSDRLLSDTVNIGGDIFIHGKCVTVGCIPLMDEQIEELYIIAAQAKSLGEDFIPIHIFPVRYNRFKSLMYLSKFTAKDDFYKKFSNRLRAAYDYFEQYHKLPVVTINYLGEYNVL